MTTKADTPRATPAAAERPTAASARALLLTVLGEFAHPRDGSAWTGTLVSALGALGVEEKSARQTIARTASQGLIESERHGRRVRWQTTPEGRALLAEGTERIYSFLRSPHTWDGEWLVVAAAVPESQRAVRHKLRTRLTWLGLGCPTPGMWIIPDAHKEAEVQATLADLDLADRAFAWVGRRAAGTDPASLIDAAWDLADVRAGYRDFTTEFAQRSVDIDAQAFVAQVELIQAWRRFPFVDPDLPAELLPPDWPGPQAATLFHTLRDRWHRRAQREWERLEQAAGERT
ncbi:PaaX family transcriptional regulator C-terminal domain-containing protein [Janibacter sp. FSL W8-0316]|uniref:PaaX family transcriptional regulator n=1 Tax=Janibacter sp. FSL W8-0316 TaxID=2975325 RepID=UPI0030F7694C